MEVKKNMYICKKLKQKIMENEEIKEKQEKLDKAANYMKNIGCGIISIILLAGIIIYCIILLGALF